MNPPRWEYRIVRVTGNVANGLNQLGLDGWEAWCIVEQELADSAEPGMPPAIIAWRVGVKRQLPALIIT